MSQSERREAAARHLRDRLRLQGNHADAETVDAVLRTLNSTRSTLSCVHRDNTELRAQLRALSGEKE